MAGRTTPLSQEPSDFICSRSTSTTTASMLSRHQPWGMASKVPAYVGIGEERIHEGLDVDRGFDADEGGRRAAPWEERCEFGVGGGFRRALMVDQNEAATAGAAGEDDLGEEGVGGRRRRWPPRATAGPRAADAGAGSDPSLDELVELGPCRRRLRSLRGARGIRRRSVCL